MDAAEARRRLAERWLGTTATARVGRVVLRPHQRRAVARARQALAEFGGVLLADATGLGKTHVALALAAGARRTLVVAPAALRDMWRRALADAGVAASFVSHEALSRRGARTVVDPPDVLVVDEAHHARNPATRRHQRLVALAAGARVVLLSATPVHNRRRELTALLSLFLGARAATLAPAELARVVVRRRARDVRDDATERVSRDGSNGRVSRDGSNRYASRVGAVPRVARTCWHRVDADASVLAALRALPPPLPPRDGADGGALTAVGLARCWASSTAALRAALRRRLAAAAALDDALAAGRHPTRRELRAWTLGDDAQQLALPLLVASSGELADVAALRAGVAAHAEGVRALLARLDAAPDADEQRAALLRDVRRRHRGERVVAFAQHAATVTALWRRLARDGGVAALTAHGAVVAGGPLSRREALARFAPRATGVPPPRDAERIDLLLTTDLLSEGVNLQDASVVVHLDVPWTPARLAQRVGRAARLGAAHARVAVYGLAPPADVAAWLRVATHLRRKASTARATLGGGRRSRAPASAHARPRMAARADARVDAHPHARTGACGDGVALDTARRLERWLVHGRERPVDAPAPPGATLVVAAVRAPRAGFVACLRDGGTPVLVAASGASVTDDSTAVARAARLAEGEGVAVPARAARRAVRALRAWLADRAAGRDCGIGGAGPVAEPLRRATLARLDRMLRDAPAHRRAALAAPLAELRAALAHPWSAGHERALTGLETTNHGATTAALDDTGWLARLLVLARAARQAPATRSGGRGAVLILLLPGARLRPATAPGTRHPPPDTRQPDAIQQREPYSPRLLQTFGRPAVSDPVSQPDP